MASVDERVELPVGVTRAVVDGGVAYALHDAGRRLTVH